MLFKKYKKKYKFVFVLFAFLFPILSPLLLPYFFDITKTNPEMQIVGADLVGLISRDSSIKAEVPIFNTLLNDNYKDKYDVVNAGNLYWSKEPILGKDFLHLPFSKANTIKKEYIRCVLKHPFLLFKLKGEAFTKVLSLANPFFFANYDIYFNKYGLCFNPNFKSERDFLEKIILIIFHGKYFKYFIGMHLLWFGINICFIICNIVLFFKSRSEKYLVLTLFMLVPLVYYLQFYLAVPVRDFRYMYPATLLMQIYLLTVTFLHSKRFILVRLSSVKD